MIKKTIVKITLGLLMVNGLTGCVSHTRNIRLVPEIYGTSEAFAEEAVYFIVTDRFVDGDKSNNHEYQGGAWKTFNRPVIAPNGVEANIGYLGGDFKGVLNNADYITDMGFTSLWLTPIIDNPDEAFSGGSKIGEGFPMDHGKTGYHGYWGVNFFKVDEHLESKDLTFSGFTQALKEKFGMKFILDVVANHGSPSFTMPVDQPKFGELYDKADDLIADHENKSPEALDKKNPLHDFFHRKKDIGELSNLNDLNPKVKNYLSDSTLQWLEQGVAALRIDTIKHVPNAYWKQFSDRIRQEYPGLFMFAEHYSFEAKDIAQHTWGENGSISVLDFPGRKNMVSVFENKSSDFSELLNYLHLNDGMYANPYDLMTFYDNHDMSRMNADTAGFINANNWLFTSRGIPVVYYGSEIGFMAGSSEHEGNRNYFGQQRVNAAKTHPIYQSLKRIAQLRKKSPALQKGVQVNLEFSGDRAAFLRVYQKGGVSQTALVLLNKGETDVIFPEFDVLPKGLWRDGFSNETILLQGRDEQQIAVAGNGVKVLLLDEEIVGGPLLDKIYGNK